MNSHQIKPKICHSHCEICTNMKRNVGGQEKIDILTPDIKNFPNNSLIYYKHLNNGNKRRRPWILFALLSAIFFIIIFMMTMINLSIKLRFDKQVINSPIIPFVWVPPRTNDTLSTTSAIAYSKSASEKDDKQGTQRKKKINIRSSFAGGPSSQKMPR